MKEKSRLRFLTGAVSEHIYSLSAYMFQQILGSGGAEMVIIPVEAAVVEKERDRLPVRVKHAIHPNDMGQAGILNGSQHLCHFFLPCLVFVVWNGIER